MRVEYRGAFDLCSVSSPRLERRQGQGHTKRRLVVDGSRSCHGVDNRAALLKPWLGDGICVDRLGFRKKPVCFRSSSPACDVTLQKIAIQVGFGECSADHDWYRPHFCQRSRVFRGSGGN